MLKSAKSETESLPSINEALGSLQEELERLRSASAFIDQSKEAAQETVEAARQVGQAVVSLAKPTQTLIERLDKVDFPSRLDKLDATVSALQAGFQAIQGRLDGVERNVKDDLRSSQEVTGERVNAVIQALDASRRQTEEALARHAATQEREMKQLRLWLWAGLAGIIALIVLQLLSR